MSTPTLLDRNGLIKGTDFMQFYTLGYLAHNHLDKLLYDPREQSEVRQRLIPEAKSIFYAPVYGPQVSLFFAPFATLNYGWALSCWLALNSLLYAVCCYLIWKACPNLKSHRFTVVVLAAAFPGFFHLIRWPSSHN